MGVEAAILGGVVGATSLAGTGLSIASSLDQGDAAAASAQFNAEQTLRDAEAQRDAANFQAKQFRKQARISKKNIELLRGQYQNLVDAGAIQERNAAVDFAARRSNARTAFAAGNISLDEGSPIDWDLSAAEEFVRQRDVIRRNTQNSLLAAEVEERNLRANVQTLEEQAFLTRESGKTQYESALLQAQFLRDQGRFSQSAAAMQAIGIGLSGVGQAASGGVNTAVGISQLG